MACALLPLACSGRQQVSLPTTFAPAVPIAVAVAPAVPVCRLAPPRTPGNGPDIIPERGDQDRLNRASGQGRSKERTRGELDDESSSVRTPARATAAAGKDPDFRALLQPSSRAASTRC
jgi:hypothetical protein